MASKTLGTTGPPSGGFILKINQLLTPGLSNQGRKDCFRQTTFLHQGLHQRTFESRTFQIKDF